jgi:hypothetical protein
MSRTFGIILPSKSAIIMHRYRIHTLFLFVDSVFVKELALVCDIFTKAMDTRTVIDFHDIMYKFTLDSFVL